MTEIFVYGTLKPGESNYPVCASSVVAARPAIALGQLYALPFGYPAMTPGTTQIQGYILALANSGILAALDRLEQHDPIEFQRYAPGQVWAENQYERTPIEVFDLDRGVQGTAWAYRMTVEQVHRIGGVLLPEGVWSPAAHASVFTDMFTEQRVQRSAE
jgi:gamma-glutamylcyclotransferase (GGCT)/AIG2-like uncharacterized protein YtfP